MNNDKPIVLNWKGPIKFSDIKNYSSLQNFLNNLNFLH